MGCRDISSEDVADITSVIPIIEYLNKLDGRGIIQFKYIYEILTELQIVLNGIMDGLVNKGSSIIATRILVATLTENKSTLKALDVDLEYYRALVKAELMSVIPIEQWKNAYVITEKIGGSSQVDLSKFLIEIFDEFLRHEYSSALCTLINSIDRIITRISTGKSTNNLGLVELINQNFAALRRSSILSNFQELTQTSRLSIDSILNRTLESLRLQDQSTSKNLLFETNFESFDKCIDWDNVALPKQIVALILKELIINAKKANANNVIIVQSDSTFTLTDNGSGLINFPDNYDAIPPEDLSAARGYKDTDAPSGGLATILVSKLIKAGFINFSIRNRSGSDQGEPVSGTEVRIHFKTKDTLLAGQDLEQ